ncbi:MAG: LamG domain-containing protein [Ilumatobacteraceae bacterium]|nr:LamG domain-containing protein [Ilumatobacteraceae bacterium]
MSIKIFKDTEANAVFIEDNNGAQFLNSLQARVQSSAISILDLSRNIDLATSVPHTDFIDENDTVYAGDVTAVVNTLNSLFLSTGTPTSNVPVITSTLTVNSVEGDVINYEMIATFGVGYEWTNLPAGLTTVEGNIRKLIGGSSLAAGTYTPTMKAINYNGEDSETLTITIANPAFSNTKSVKFNNNDYCDAAASTANPLHRASNGAGSGDAWTIACWFKAGTNTNSEQTIVMFGGGTQGSEGRVQLWHDGSTNDEHLRLRIGTDNDYIELHTPDDGIVIGTWVHIVVTYDGGTTGDDQNDLSDYYGRFEIFLDGASVTLTNSNSNDGWAGSIVDDFFTVGRNGSSSNYLRNNANIDELALWASDQTANIAAIYNSGTPHDLSLLGTAPTHWWRMGDGDTFPTLTDSIGSLDLTMNSMTSADIVNDVPS